METRRVTIVPLMDVNHAYRTLKDTTIWALADRQGQVSGVATLTICAWILDQ